MAKVRAGGIAVLIVTTVLVYLLDHPLGALPALGRLLDPVNGCWANAEPVKQSFSETKNIPGLKAGVTVWYDERLVPHIHAANEHDLYFVEGYIHASFRLWQMDMETRAAAGRVSEVVGEKAIAFDRKQRYKGMVYAAENSLRAGELDPRTKLSADAYTEGVNAYISSLCYRTLPFEYKLMGFAPEKWTNLKVSLLLKYMADDLTGKTDDMALTYLRDVLPREQLDLLFPDVVRGSVPVIPAGTVFDKPSLVRPAAPPDSIAFPHFVPADFGERKEDGKGSNSWVLSGSRTASGSAMLCNDPHLSLNLPSLWYEVQLQCPGQNSYGASLPGTPGIIIGFTDSVAWGFTNNYRDVKDFYLIRPVEGSPDKYWFAGRQLDYAKRVEVIRIKNKPDEIDTVRYTIHGPVTDAAWNASGRGLRRPLATCWMGHRGTNEMLAIYLLNRARNYDGFVDAILHFECPAQNMAYADASGNIAMWGQGQFVNKWKDQGKYIMNGSDSSTLWKELIPMRENPHAYNPLQGYVASANQVTTDSTYPYAYNGSGWVNLRAWRINKVLGGMQKATFKDMFDLQQDTYSVLAESALPVMLDALSGDNVRQGAAYLGDLRKWDYALTADSRAATFFQVWWFIFYEKFWGSKLRNIPDDHLPLQEVTAQLMKLRNSARPAEYWSTGDIQKMDDAVNMSFKATIDSVGKLEKSGGAEWYRVKNTTVSHLTRLPAMSYDHLKVGGWGNTVNAVKNNHGPSWRMVVQMGREIEAYGVYPGGQSGNPGSKYYGDFIPYWTEGKYYRLHFMPNTEKQEKNVKYTLTAHP